MSEESNKWQPIESAPLGVDVLIYIDKEIQLAYGKTNKSGKFCGWCIFDGGGDYSLSGKPTHWMPLPNPPTN